MKVVSFKYLSRKKNQKRHLIVCTKSVFKPLMYAMSFMLVFMFTNLVVNDFFVNINASLQNFIDSFMGIGW